MTYLIFLVPAWGHIAGGINSLNHDLVCALGEHILTKEYKLLCISSKSISPEDLVDAEAHNVILRTLDHNTETPYQADQWLKIKGIIAALGDVSYSYCLGHDIFTGPYAAQFHEMLILKGKSIFMHHMNYEAYSNMKPEPNQEENHSKYLMQLKAIGDSKVVIAVGPKLLGSAIEKKGSNENVYEILPGIEKRETAGLPSTFRVITFGRYDKRNDALKQMLLSAKAFVSYTENARCGYDDATFTVVGTSANTEITDFKAMAIEGSNRSYQNINGQAYQTNRESLFTILRSHSVCLMLSVHEGFGLVGMEAITAGVPLVLSKNTGLYMFLEAFLGVDQFHKHGIYPVEISGGENGEINPGDIERIKDAYAVIHQNIQEFKLGILRLRELLLKSHTWTHSAQQFIEIVEQDMQKQEGYVTRDKREILRSVIRNLNAQTKLQPVLDSGLEKAPDVFAFRNRSWALSGRESELAQLKDFTGSDKTFDWWIITGEGGAGKSRLALELAIDLIEKEDWNAGFFSGSISSFNWSLWRPTHDTLIIVDDASAKKSEVEQLLKDLRIVHSTNNKRVRLLLTERQNNQSWWRRFQTGITAGQLDQPFANSPLSLGPLSQNGLIKLINGYILTGHGGLRLTRSEILDKLQQTNNHELPLYALMGMSNMARDRDTTGSNVIQTSLDLDQQRIWKNIDIDDPHAQKRLIAYVSMAGEIEVSQINQLIRQYPDLFPLQPNPTLLQSLGMYSGVGIVYPRQPRLLGIHFIHNEFVAPADPLDKVMGIENVAALAWENSPAHMNDFIMSYIDAFPLADISSLLPSSPAQLGEDKQIYFDILETQAAAIIARTGLQDPSVAEIYNKAISDAHMLDQPDDFKVSILGNMLEAAARNQHHTHVGGYIEALSKIAENSAAHSHALLECCYVFFRLGTYHARMLDQLGQARYEQELQNIDDAHKTGASLELLTKLKFTGLQLRYIIGRYEEAEAFNILHPLGGEPHTNFEPNEFEMRSILVAKALIDENLDLAKLNHERLISIFSQDPCLQNRKGICLSMGKIIKFSILNGHPVSEIISEFKEYALESKNVEIIESWIGFYEHEMEQFFRTDEFLAHQLLEDMLIIFKTAELSQKAFNLYWMSLEKGIDFHLDNLDLEKANALLERMQEQESKYPDLVDPVSQCGIAVLFAEYFKKKGNHERAAPFDKIVQKFKILENLGLWRK